MFYFRLLTFFKIKFIQINHPGTTIGVSNSLDPDQERQNPLACKELLQVNTLVFNMVTFNMDIHVYVYHKYSDTLNTFGHAMPFKQSNSNIQRV